MSKHTPAPWVVEYDDFDDQLSVNSDDRRATDKVAIATIAVNFNEPFEAEQRANAALIGAAPELPEALEAMMSPRMNGPDSVDIWRQATAAVEKAKGQ